MVASSPTSLPGTPSEPRYRTPPAPPADEVVVDMAPGRYPHPDLTQSRIDTPDTANRAARRSAKRRRRTPLALLLVPVVLVAVGVVLLLAFKGGDGGGILDIGGAEPDDTVPPFEFRLSKTGVVATVENADVGAMQAQADAVAEEITPLLDDLYTDAFLDPTKWREGDYEEAFAIFAPDALASAQQGAEALTLGAAAGDVYERVTPRRGSLQFRVLFDLEGAPDTVVVEVSFTALGQRLDGTYTAIVSTGELFLKDEGGWKVTAFKVSRGDRDTQPPPSPTPSSSASATTS